MQRNVLTHVVPRIVTALLFCCVLPTASASAQAVTPFDSSRLVAFGDTVKYGSYVVYKIGDGIYKINDPGVTTGKGGAWGVDMYLICGESRALLIDLGNNYIDGCAKDVIAPRKNAAEELREVVRGLAGDRPLEAAITHAHPDHDGMTGAFLDGKATLWMSDGEDKTALQTQHSLDPSVYKLFPAGKKAFDLGGGRTVETIPVRGHSNGGTVYLLKKDKLLFTGDAIGSGFGQSMRAVDRLRTFAEDTRALVDYVTANLTPYERYALRVYTGHTWQNVHGGFLSPNKDKIDVGYLDWRFVQNVASCASGILGGKWLVEGSGLVQVGKMAYTDAWPGAAGQAIMLYGIGTIIIPLETAYEAAGLKMPQASFDPSPLVRLGDSVTYGSYRVHKIAERIYQITDPGVTTGKSGAFGVDMYLVCGEHRALMIDLGNNYIDGYAKDVIAPRPNAAEELREVVYGLVGQLPLEIALTHAHPDHDGMTGAFINRNATLWMSDREDRTALQTQHGLDPSVYAVFTPGQKAFDLGGGRIVETMLVRGHSDGGTVYILKKDGIVFTGDVFGNGVGATQGTVEKLKGFAEDSRKLVDYLSANLTPYERYALKVYVGHHWLNVYNGYFTPKADKVDIGYLDWRYLQNMASCANKILGGKWLVEGSGLRHVGNMPYVDFWPNAVGKAILIDGIGAEVIPIEMAYEAAGLKMPK